MVEWTLFRDCLRNIYKLQVYLMYTMQQITTVKLQKSTKNSLDEVRRQGESYEAVIKNLLQEHKMKNIKETLKEGYQTRGAEDSETLKEWEPSSHELGKHG